MPGRWIVATLLVVAAGCAKSHDVSAEGLTAAGTGDSASGTDARAGRGGTAVGGGSGAETSGTSGAPDTSGGGAGVDGSQGGSMSLPAVPQEGGQLGPCSDEQDCDDGLRCNGSGGYCSRECGDDADCASLGESYTCSGSGTCRLECQGEDDDSCPQGMSCEQGGGRRGGGTFRCAFPEPEEEQDEDEQDQDEEGQGRGNR
jgi:hypothetical protein